MRIALLGYRSHPQVGGQGVYLHYFSRALVELGHQVDVISGDPMPELDPRVRLIALPGLNLYERNLTSVRFKEFKESTAWVEWFSKLTGGFAEPWSFCHRALQWIKQQGCYDIVHDNQSLGSGLLSLLASGQAVTATIHHPVMRDLELALSNCTNWKQRLLLKRWYSFVAMQKRVACGLPKIITVSHASKQDIMEDFGIAAEKIHVAHNGIDTDFYKPIKTPKSKKRRLMVVSSSDQPLKGVRYMLLAYADLIKRFDDLELFFVGSIKVNGENAKLIKKLGIANEVRYVSEVSALDLITYYAQATIVVVPSLYEGFGFPVVEAMACEVPVVCTDGGALKEVAGDAAHLVAAGDVKSLVQGISLLLENTDYQRSLAKKGRQRVLRYFSWRQNAESVAGLYSEIIAEKIYAVKQQ